MNISRNKSLIREIAPGVFQIGNNPFAPSLSLNENSGTAEFLGQKILIQEDLQNITGASLTYDNGVFTNRPIAENKKVLIEGDLDAGLSQLNALLDDEIASRITGDANLLNEIDESSQQINEKLNQEILNRSRGDEIIRDNLEFKISEEATVLATEINLLSGHFSTQTNSISGSLNEDINDLELNLSSDISNIESELENISINGSGITYEEAQALAKKWAIILG